ncbi:uncharacterized protein LOC143920681 [Arctopsyche grandis]|uniref:uncharacterized protein LOC143920681 n=1 Tax=Arctopsyche grandis TaxID=121162 RepID=UPI00406DA079
MIEKLLKGDCMKERHRNLNQLIAKVTAEEFTPDYIASLSTKSQLDQIFLAALADRFKNSSIVCNLLKSEDEIVVSKILRCKWFFEGTINKDIVNPDYFFTELIPYVTYATRCKIITNLGIHLKDTELAERFYVRISEEYSNTIAVKLLSVCSEEFIKTQLCVNNLDIPENQLKQLYRKYPKLIVEYVKTIFRADSQSFLPVDYGSVFELIARDYIAEIVEIFKSRGYFPTSFNFGYRLTLILLECDKKLVIENAEKISRSLNIEALLKVLKGEERDQFIINVFPSKRDTLQYKYGLEYIFKHFKPEYACSYLIKLYKKAYKNESILDTEDFPEKFVIHLPVDLKEEWAKKMISRKKEQEERYLKYMNTDFAIKRFIELNNSTPNIDKRITLLTSMIDCCKAHNDTVALLNVLKYVAKRHRNDQENLRYRFVDHLQTTFPLHTLSTEHWEVIDEMMKVIMFNDEIKKYHRQYFLATILEQSIHYRIINNIEFESVIDVMMEYNLNKLNLLTDNPELETRILNVFMEKYKFLILNQPMTDDVVLKIELVLESYLKKNDKSNTVRSINDHPWLLEVVKLWSETSKNKRFHYILRILSSHAETKAMFIEDIFKYAFDQHIFRNALTHNSKVIFDNIDTVMEYTPITHGIQNYIREYRRIRAYMNDTLGRTIKERLERDIANYETERSDKFAGLIINLSLLLDNYDEYLKDYVPSMAKIVLSDEGQVEYKRTQELIETFKYVNPPISFETVLIFVKEDYFKFGLPSLLSLCYRKSGIETCAFVKELARKPVSVKKHSIRLSHFLLPKREVLSIFEEMWKIEKNSSIRDVLCQRTFKIFTKETNLEMCSVAFDMLKIFYESFQECDKNLFHYLHAVDSVKPQFLSDYCQVSWNTLKSLEKRILDVDFMQSNLVYGISRNIEHMSEELCEILTKEYLNLMDQTDKSVVGALSTFCVFYLLQAKSLEAQSKHVAEFCTITASYIKQHWNTVHETQFKYRTSIRNFLKAFCTVAVRCKFTVNPLALLKSLHEMIKSVLPFEVIPDIMLHYLLVMSFVESLEKPFEDKLVVNCPETIEFLQKFAGGVVRLFEFFISTYGSEVLGLFSTILAEVLDHHGRNIKLNLYFIKQMMLTENKTRSFMILVLGLMPTQIDRNDAETAAIYDILLKEISSHDDMTVKMVYGQNYETALSFFIN